MKIADFLNNESKELTFSYIDGYDLPDLMKRVNIYNNKGTKIKFDTIASFATFITRVEMVDYNEDQGNWSMEIYV